MWILENRSKINFSAHVIRSLVLCVCFVDRCLSFCTFSLGHCVVCSFSIYGFRLPLWYLQTLLQQLCYNLIYVVNQEWQTISPPSSPTKTQRTYFVNLQDSCCQVFQCVVLCRPLLVLVLFLLAIAFGGGNRKTRRKPSTCHKSLTNLRPGENHRPATSH